MGGRQEETKETGGTMETYGPICTTMKENIGRQLETGGD